MKSIALDTNITIDLLKGLKDVIEVLKRFEIVYLYVTMVGELLFCSRKTSVELGNHLSCESSGSPITDKKWSWGSILPGKPPHVSID